MIKLSEQELTSIFFAIILLLSASLISGYVFQKLKLPRVIGEILGGLLLGPTVLGAISPGIYAWIFNAFESEGKLIAAVSWLGLVLLMFVSGFEIQTSLDRDDKKTIVALLIGSSLPFFAGWIAPLFYDFSPYLGEKRNMLALTIVVGIAVAVTSIPVISKIFLDLKMMQTRFAKIVLTAATFHDVLLWVALAIATGLVSAEQPTTIKIASHVVVTLVFIGATVTLMPKVMSFLNGFKYNLLLRSSRAGYVLSLCFLFAGIAGLLGINVIFGAFLAGVVLGMMPKANFAQEKTYIKEFAMAFFVPLYFAVVGLKLDLIHHFDIRFFLFLLLFTTTFGTLGTVMAARMIRKDWLSSFNLAVAMNTRGGPGIVLATVAFDFGIINEMFFVALVLIALLTSLLAGAWFKFLLSHNYELLKDQESTCGPTVEVNTVDLSRHTRREACIQRHGWQASSYQCSLDSCEAVQPRTPSGVNANPLPADWSCEAVLPPTQKGDTQDSLPK